MRAGSKYIVLNDNFYTKMQLHVSPQPRQNTDHGNVTDTACTMPVVLLESGMRDYECCMNIKIIIRKVLSFIHC